MCVRASTTFEVRIGNSIAKASHALGDGCSAIYLRSKEAGSALFQPRNALAADIHLSLTLERRNGRFFIG